eukprot:628789-Alexandrium_andersonii.AAC.1
MRRNEYTAAGPSDQSQLLGPHTFFPKGGSEMHRWAGSAGSRSCRVICHNCPSWARTRARPPDPRPRPQPEEAASPAHGIGRPGVCE